MSNENKMIYKAISAAMDDIDAIGKNSKNIQQGFLYRSIDDVYNVLHPILARNKIFTVTEVLEAHKEERQTAKGGTLIYRVLKIKYTMYAEDGSNISGVVIGEGMDSGDKAANKAMAIAHKYFLTQLFSIPTDEPKDPDAESHEVVRNSYHSENTVLHGQANPSATASDKQISYIYTLCTSKGFSSNAAGVLPFIKFQFKMDIKEIKDLTAKQASEVINYLQNNGIRK